MENTHIFISFNVFIIKDDTFLLLNVYKQSLIPSLNILEICILKENF